MRAAGGDVSLLQEPRAAGRLQGWGCSAARTTLQTSSEYWENAAGTERWDLCPSVTLAHLFPSRVLLSASLLDGSPAAGSCPGSVARQWGMCFSWERWRREAVAAEGVKSLAGCLGLQSPLGLWVQARLPHLEPASWARRGQGVGARSVGPSRSPAVRASSRPGQQFAFARAQDDGAG